MDAIRTERLSRSFGGLVAVNELGLTVARGELFGLVGPDGAGKTTTMRLLASIMDPTSGEAWVAGRHTVREAEAVKERIGYMSQRFGLYADLTVAENLSFYADIYGVVRRELAARTERLLEFSGLGAFRGRLAGNLSGGMKQKLGLACALVHSPEVLLLDEPTNGVDPVSRREFWRILYGLLREGVTVFVSTAYLDEAERCARVGLLHQGRLLACAPPAEVKKLMRGAILEVRAADPRRAAAELREGLGALARSVGLFGDRVHVVTDEAEAADARIRGVLGEAAATRRIEPSLEDVLVSLTER